MSDTQPEEDQPGIEFDYMADGEQLHTAVIVRDPSKIAAAISATIQWIPTHMGDPAEGYPGAEALKRRVEAEDCAHLPMLVIQHMPASMPPDKAMEQIDHQLYLVDQEVVMNMIGSGIHMFTQDVKVTNAVMHALTHLLADETECEHEDGDETD